MALSTNSRPRNAKGQFVLGFSAEERFWPKVDKNGPNGCWVWLASKDTRGYGFFSINGGNRMAHRIAYTLIKGPIPKGLQIDHLCRNSSCVNPAHMELVNNRQNVLRGNGLTAQNAVKTHCPQGHPYDLLNTYFFPDGKGRQCRICKQMTRRLRREV